MQLLHSCWLFYNKKIIKSCNSTELVHFVLKVVGFGEEKKNKKLERQIMSGFDQQNIIGCHRTDILMKTKKKIFSFATTTDNKIII